MLRNLLLSDPDNIPSGYAGLDIQPIMTLLITIIAIIITIIAAYIIYYMYKNSKNEEITNKKWIPYTIIIGTIIITILLVILCCIAVSK